VGIIGKCFGKIFIVRSFFIFLCQIFLIPRLAASVFWILKKKQKMPARGTDFWGKVRFLVGFF